MVLHETEDITFKKLETYKFGSRLSVTVILDEVKDGVETINVEKNNPPANETINCHQYTSELQYTKPCECTPQCNHVQKLLDILSKNLIAILQKYYSTCDYSCFLHFKYDLFRISQKTVVDVILPRESDHSFIQSFLKNTKNRAMSANCLIYHHESIDRLFWELINFTKGIVNDKRESNGTNPLLIDKLQYVSDSFTSNKIGTKNQNKIEKRKSTNKKAAKRKKTTSEEAVSVTTSYNSLVDDIFSYTQHNNLNVPPSNVKEKRLECLNEKAMSPVLIVGENNLQSQIETCDTSSITSPIITFVTSLNPQRSPVANGNCKICNTVTANLCVGCYKHYYCSYECQASDWPLHQYECCKPT